MPRMQKITHWLSLLAFCCVIQSSPTNAQSANNLPSKMSIEKATFGITSEGQNVDLYTLKNTNGLTVKVLTYGAIIYSVEAPDKNGHSANLTANCASLADYENR